METVDFVLRGEFVELHKLLKFQGLADSGGGAKALVASRAVRVDGQVETRKGCKLRGGQRVEAENVVIVIRAAPAA